METFLVQIRSITAQLARELPKNNYQVLNNSAVCPPEKLFSSVRTLEYILSIYSYKRVGREMHLNFVQNLVGGSIAAAVGKGRVGHDMHVHARWREPKNNVPGEHRTWHLANYLRSAEIIAYNQLS